MQKAILAPLNRRMNEMYRPLKTFIIYASQDREFHAALERQLKSLIDNSLLELWSDKEILPGERWDAAIKKKLLESELFLMLISADFFNSNYIREEEFSLALEKLERGEAIVVPIIVRDCDWEAYKVISDLQVLPPGGHPVTKFRHWGTVDDAWAEVVRSVRRMIELKREKEAEAEKLRQAEIVRQKELAAKKARQKEMEAEKARQAALGQQNKAEVEIVSLVQLRKKPAPVPSRPRYSYSYNPIKIGYVILMMLLIVLVWTKPWRFLMPEKSKVTIAELISKRKSGLSLQNVQGGTFLMGSPENEIGHSAYESPQHQVTLKDFKIGIYEVTQADWRAVMGNNPSAFNNCDDCPVEQVSWNDVQAFLKKLNALLPPGSTPYRLPSEAEWEYAAGGGRNSQNSLYSRGADLKELAWYGDNSNNKTHPVGGKKANELGLYDMSGNVWEWCEDDWHADYKNAPLDGRAWIDSGARGSSRVDRGGSWLNGPQFCRVTYRGHWQPVNRFNDLGFRVAASQ